MTPPVDAYQAIRQAILERKQIVATYESKRREMCPHVIGTKDGRQQCLSYQFAGESSHTIFPLSDPMAYRNWRCMEIAKLSNVQVRDGDWYSLSRHTRPQTCVDIVDVEVPGWE